MTQVVRRRRNDVRQYDDLADQWWDTHGEFAMLHWIAVARNELIPPPARAGAVLVDLACGGGLMAPYVRERGYHHVGLDLTSSALAVAAARGTLVAQADVSALPLPDGVADVVLAGEILEHVSHPMQVVVEAVRVLRPGGRLIIDTIAATRRARLLAVSVAERIPGLAPRGIHDPALFVDRDELLRTCVALGMTLQLQGLRLDLGSLARWRKGSVPAARMVPTSSTAVVFQAWGTKPGQPVDTGRADAVAGGYA